MRILCRVCGRFYGSDCYYANGEPSPFRARQTDRSGTPGAGTYIDGDIEPVRTLFVDLENSAAQTRREFRPLLISAGDRYVGGMLIPIIQPTGIDLCNRADVEWLRERLERNAPIGMLCMGPLYKMAHGDFDEVADAIIEAIDHIRDDYGCAVILEAHSLHASGGGHRPKRPYGLSSFLGWPEFGFHHDPPPDPTDDRTLRNRRTEHQRPRPAPLPPE